MIPTHPAQASDREGLILSPSKPMKIVMAASHPADKSIINCRGFRQLKTHGQSARQSARFDTAQSHSVSYNHAVTSGCDGSLAKSSRLHRFTPSHSSSSQRL